MFTNMSESEAKEKIFESVKEYYKEFHKDKEYIEGDRVNYSGRVYDEKEMINLVDASLDFWLTGGKYTLEFERKMCEYLNVKYASLVNSGSSANLLAFMALTSPLLGKRKINRGDEVITVAAGFPTTITPILQYGAVPVFVDITIPEYNIDVNLLEKALSSKTKAIILAHTLGNPFDLKIVKEFCDKNNLWLIEDNCDAFGSKYILNGKEFFTGTIGDIGTSSFYPPHHITMGEGGCVYTNNPLLNKIVRSMRDWGRDCMCPPGKDNVCGKRFEHKYDLLPEGYDHKYVYSHFGYNLKATDLQASIGVAQLDKIDDFTKKRIDNFDYLKDNLKDIDEIVLPNETTNSIPSWFGFLITVKDNKKSELVKFLEDNNIQTRMLFCGNIINQPCFDEIRGNKKYYRVVGELNNTNYVMNNSFWIGVYPGMSKKKLDYMIKKIKEFFDK